MSLGSGQKRVNQCEDSHPREALRTEAWEERSWERQRLWSRWQPQSLQRRQSLWRSVVMRRRASMERLCLWRRFLSFFALTCRNRLPQRFRLRRSVCECFDLGSPPERSRLRRSLSGTRWIDSRVVRELAPTSTLVAIR